jgi:uncharacterized lipoprotein YajG
MNSGFWNEMKTRIPLSLGAVLALLVVTGCGSLKVTPTYTATKKGPLSTVAPQTVSLRVNDERPAEERVEVGRLYNAFGGVARKIESIPAVTNVIRDTLKSELENNGHRVVDSSQPADVKIDVDLKRFFYECKPKMWDVEVVVTTVTQLNITKGGKNAPPVAVNATHRKSRQLVGNGSHVKIINDGLAEYARSASMDPNLQEAFSDTAKAAVVK